MARSRSAVPLPEVVAERVDLAALVAAVAVLAVRAAGRRDVAVGVPVSTSKGSALAAVRLRIQDSASFAELLEAVRSKLARIEPLEEPFDPAELGHHPVVQVVAAVRPEGAPAIDPDRLRLSPEAPPFDCVFLLDRSTGPAVLVVDHDAVRFAIAGRVHLDAVVQILVAGLSEPRMLLRSIPLVSATGTDVLLRWAVASAEYPRERGIAELFALQVHERPEAVAVVDGGRTVTYGELGRRSAALAARLAASGVSRGMPVALALGRSLELVVAMVAVVRAGGVYVPMDVAYPAQRLLFMLQDAAAPVILTHSGLLGRLSVPEGTEVLCLDRLDREGTAERHDLDGSDRADDLAYITYTSGSTGLPKGVAVPQRGVVRLILGADYARFGPDETFLHLAAVTFDLTTLEVWGPLLTGGRLVIFTEERPTPDGLSQVLARERVTFLWLTAGLFHQMAEARPGGLAPVTQLLAGGDALQAAACRQILAASRRTLLIDGYGPTENTTFSTCHPMTAPEVVSDPVSIGRPIAGSEAFVVGPALDLLPPLVPGELLVGGDGLARGYWRRPALTARSFVPHPHARKPGERLYRTGDLARWRTDGTLEFLGRRDHQIKLRGFRIELPEIESVLQTHPGVGEVAVVARDVETVDGLSDRMLVAYVVPPAGRRAPAPRDLRDHAAVTLPEHMLPAAYVALESMPLSPNGKLDRRALPEPGPEARPMAAEHLAPTTPVERTVAAIWSEVLGVERPGLTDDFFELGGHSLLAASIFARVADTYGVRVPISSLFHERTLGRFARAVEEARGDAVGSLPPIAPRAADERERAPLSYPQRGLWLSDRLRPDSPVNNLPTLFRLRGAGLEPARLARALREIVRRHEALRTSFGPGADGLGEQWIHPPDDELVPLPVVDCSALPLSLRGPAATAALVAEARRPFDLGTEGPAERPPVRSLLIRVDAEDHRLLFHSHHIVFDGWSTEIFAVELRTLYRAAPGDGVALPPLPIQPADHAVWQREVLTEAELAPEIELWREHLRGVPPVLELPGDRLRPKVLSGRGSQVALRISPAIRDALEELARSEGATLFMALLAGFGAILGRWSGRDDLAIGSPFAGRMRPELEGLVGFFVNVVVVRSRLDGEPTFRQLLGRAREETAHALSHTLLPFDRLVAALGTNHDGSHHPVVQVLFAGQDYDLLDGELAPGIGMAAQALDSGTAKVDLTLFADRRAGAIEARFEYSSDLFDRVSIERLAGHLVRWLEQAVAAPDLGLDRFDLLTVAERRLLLGPWRGRRTGYPREAGLAELFDRQVAERPDAVAVAQGGLQLTFRGLDRRARRLARRIARVGGARRGLRIGLAIERSVELVVAVLAVVRAGGSYVPLEVDYPEERLSFLAEDADLRVLVTDGAGLALLPMLGRRSDLAVVRLDEADPPVTGNREPLPETLAGPDDAAYLCYTSGSTGRPKGAVVPQRAVARLVLEADYAHFGPEETQLLLAPASFDAATLELWGPLLNGGRLVVHPAERPTPEGLGALLARERVSTLWLTAGLFHQMIEDAPRALEPLRRLLAGGDVLSPELCRRLLAERPGLVLVNGYGPTENTTFTCCHEMRGSDAVEAPVPIGRPISDTDVVVVDRRMGLQPVGVAGELATGGDGLAWGYWKRPALTAERFVPDPFAGVSGRPGARLYRTGDLARWRSDGVLEFLGRSDGQVKVRGFRIELGEIETVLVAHPSVLTAVVVARSAAAGVDRVLVAYVVAREAGRPAEEALRDWLVERLPPHMVPGAILVLDSLPLDPNGKVDRRALPDPTEMLASHARPIAPRTATERAVAAIWSEVLEVEDLALGNDFFRLGGHSLLAARVLSRLRAKLGVEIPFPRLFELRTLGAFAGAVEAAAAAGDGGAPERPAGEIRKAIRRRIVRSATGGPGDEQ